MNHSTADISRAEFFASQAQVWEARDESRTYQQRRDLLLQSVKKMNAAV